MRHRAAKVIRTFAMHLPLNPRLISGISPIIRQVPPQTEQSPINLLHSGDVSGFSIQIVPKMPAFQRGVPQIDGLDKKVSDNVNVMSLLSLGIFPLSRDTRKRQTDEFHHIFGGSMSHFIWGSKCQWVEHGQIDVI